MVYKVKYKPNLKKWVALDNNRVKYNAETKGQVLGYIEGKAAREGETLKIYKKNGSLQDTKYKNKKSRKSKSL